MRRYCPQCGFVYWERPLPAAATVIVNSRQPSEIVLVRRRYPPEEGQWTLPGGGIESGESAAEAAVREAREETGLVVAIDDELGAWSTPSRETVVIFYLAHVLGGRLKGGTDALEARWVVAESAPQLAFSTHREALAKFMQRRVSAK
jgi:ADP-ribose pyrophosphatase YjhB (NUDIX family)